jgi:hypothetical protein
VERRWSGKQRVSWSVVVVAFSDESLKTWKERGVSVWPNKFHSIIRGKIVTLKYRSKAFYTSKEGGVN